MPSGLCDCGLDKARCVKPACPAHEIDPPGAPVEIYEPGSSAVKAMAALFMSSAPIGHLTQAQRHTIGVALQCLKQEDVEALWERDQDRHHGGVQP